MYAKEIATDEHYILDDTAYPIEFKYAGQDTATVNISVNGGNEIDNKIIYGTIVGKKIDEDGFTIAGATFGLFANDATEFTKDTAILVSVSNEIGIFYFENVPFGKYIVREITPAQAFVLNETSYEVEITEIEEIIQIEVENKFIVGSVQTVKVDADYPDNKLSGAVFEIYFDSDKNKEFSAEIDILIGEMTEIELGVYRMDELRFAGYFLHEKVAPIGYVLDEGYYYFEIVNDGEIVNIVNNAGENFTNQAIKGNISILKKDATSGEVLSGVEFGLFDTNGNEIVRGVTGDDGSLLFEGIRFGTYELRELTAKTGYHKNDEIIMVEISENAVTLTYEITNEKIPDTLPPYTGVDTNIGLFIALMVISSIGLIVISISSIVERNKLKTIKRRRSNRI